MEREAIPARHMGLGKKLWTLEGNRSPKSSSEGSETHVEEVFEEIGQP
jgi:hypothetical protein